jgi:hypothetical protein
MAGVSELDTLGAWLLEKISRQALTLVQISSVPCGFAAQAEVAA